MSGGAGRGAPRCPRRCNYVPAQVQPASRCSVFLGASKHSGVIRLLRFSRRVLAFRHGSDEAMVRAAGRPTVGCLLGAWAFGGAVRVHGTTNQASQSTSTSKEDLPSVGATEGDAGIRAMTARFISKHPLQNLTRSTYRLYFERYCVPLDGRAQGALGKARKPLSVDNDPC